MSSDAAPSTRRAYLRAVGAGALAALAGCGEYGRETTESRTETESVTDRAPGRTTGGAPTEATDEATTETTDEADTATSEPPVEEYGTVVNMVEAGADDSGDAPVDSVVEERVGDDTLLYFPPGRYRLTELELVGYRSLGIYGDDAAFVPPSDKTDYWLRWGELDAFRFEGIDFDWRADGVAPVWHLSTNGGANVVRDVSVLGRHDADHNGVEVAVTDPKGELLFERVTLAGGSLDGAAIYTFPKSVGKLTFRDCRIEHWGEGLYASPHSGPLRVEGGYYANNGVVQVRVGGGHQGAVVTGVTVRADDPRNPSAKQNMRGIWQEEGEHVRIEDCDIAITDLTDTYSSGGVVVGRQGGGGEIRNTRIRTDANTYGIHVRHPIRSMAGQTMPSMDYIPDDRRVTCENVDIVGSATKYAAVRTDRRDGCSFENLCVRHPSDGRDGVVVENADGCSVRNSTIKVGGRTIRTENATVNRDDVRTDGSC